MNLSSPPFSSSFSKHSGGLQRCLSLYCSMKYVSRRIKVDTERKGWMFDMDFLYLVQLWHEYTVKGWTGHSWRSRLRELHTWFLSSEWICLHVGKLFIVSPQKKILFRVLLLFNWFKWYCFGVTAIFNTADWWIFMFFLTVMSLQCSAVIVAHALFFVLFFFSGLVIQFFFRLLFFPSLLYLFRFQLLWPTLLLSAHYTLKNGVLAHQLHCSGSDTCGFLFLTGCVKSVTLVTAQPGYYYYEILCLELQSCKPDPTILVVFPLQRNHLWTHLTYLKSG